VIVTGFTGLVDKRIVEKLVYSIRDIHTIIICLFNLKKEVNTQQTLETMIG